MDQSVNQQLQPVNESLIRGSGTLVAIRNVMGSPT